jgi:alcohol dehydrogenase YqhD (iron-dependent ADH family)
VPPPESIYTGGMDTFEHVFEQFKVAGKDLAAKVRELIHEGNVRRIILKNESGHTLVEIPVTVAAIGVVAAPVLAAVAALAAMISMGTIVVERSQPPSGGASGSDGGTSPEGGPQPS